MKRHLIQTLRLILISALAGAAWVAHRPAPLPEVPPPKKQDDILDLLHQSAIKRAAVMEISEADINRHLSHTLAAKPGSGLGSWVVFEGARIDLEPGCARIFLVWNFKGHLRTASVDLAISRDEHDFHVEMLHGAYGHLQMPRGMMRPLYPALRAVAETLDPEIRALFQMTNITIAKDKLVLDPRFPPA